MNNDSRHSAPIDTSTDRFEAALPLDQVPPGRIIRVAVGGADLLLCRFAGNEVYAIQNRCSHMAKPLHGGRLIGYHISCPEHGAEFDIRSGEALGFPAVRPIRTYSVEIRDNIVYVAVQIGAAG
jgi:3-phenylpropionate/trans-cinnamate dioxygenase ferredoxin component